MKKVCVITGGGKGMGLEAAKYLGKYRKLVLSGRTASKLEEAVRELKNMGIEAYPFACDVSKRQDVCALAEYAASLGTITNVINAAGISPHMGDGNTILRINALGTVHVNQEFSKRMEQGTVIVDVSSNSAYVLPDFLVSEKLYALADTDEEEFVERILKRCKIAKEGYQRNGFAYAFSKNFVIWYAKKSAYEYGRKGIRVCSLSPGLIATDMGKLEAEEGGSMILDTAEERMGYPEELGFALATVADERNGYLAGVDVLCDGGATHGKKFKAGKKSA